MRANAKERHMTKTMKEATHKLIGKTLVTTLEDGTVELLQTNQLGVEGCRRLVHSILVTALESGDVEFLTSPKAKEYAEHLNNQNDNIEWYIDKAKLVRDRLKAAGRKKYSGRFWDAEKRENLKHWRDEHETYLAKLKHIRDMKLEQVEVEYLRSLDSAGTWLDYVTEQTNKTWKTQYTTQTMKSIFYKMKGSKHD